MKDFTTAELERYSRQLVLPEFGPKGQESLKKSRVAVVGSGGLGLPASTYLAAAGVGRIDVIDDDAVEKSNLHRQTLYSEDDVGRPKAEVATERLKLVNPYVSINPHIQKLDSTNALDLLQGADVVLDCTDNFPARYLINDACLILHKPDVYASVFRFDGQLSVFDGDRGPCYRCLFPSPPPPDSVQDCAVAGVLGVLPGILGSMQAAQAIDLLTGIGKPLVGRLVLMDATSMEFTELKMKRNPACPGCGDGGRISKLIDYEEFCGIRPRLEEPDELVPRQLKAMIDEGRQVVILDVREPFENSLVRIDGSKLIPLAELPERVGELDPAAETVVYCHIGVRSARAVEFLRSRGFKNVRNLRGGIDAWADDVDPRLPRY